MVLSALAESRSMSRNAPTRSRLARSPGDDAEQAHTYSAHPEIAAYYFLVTNGREFRLYQTGRLDKPVMDWTFDEIEARLPTLFNILGYDALRRMSALIVPDTDKPLGPGLRSKMRIVGGQVKYGEHRSTLPDMGAPDVLNGATGAINGVEVSRDESGMLHAVIDVTPPYSSWKTLNEAVGIKFFSFKSADAFISVDKERPTILQNVFKARMLPGTMAQIMPNLPPIEMPIGFDVTAYTEATGWVEDGEFKGLLRFSFDYDVLKPANFASNPMAQMVAQKMGDKFHVDGDGTFIVRFKPFD